MNKYREFRGITLTGEWVTGSLCETTSQHRIFNGTDFIEVSSTSIGQNTGLTISGTEQPIYEGDIIRCQHDWTPKDKMKSLATKIEMVYTPEPEDVYKEFMAQKIKYAYGKKRVANYYPFYELVYYRNYVVERDVETGGWRMRNKDVFHPLTQTVIYNRKVAVIGNIFENKELLEDWKNEINDNERSEEHNRECF